MTTQNHAPRSPNDVDLYVGSRIRLRRQMLKMSQEKLGNKLGVTFQQVQKYERGANRVGASRLWRLSRVLDVPIGFFYEDMAGIFNLSADVSGDTKAALDFIGSTDGVAFAAALIKIPKDARRQLLQLARSMAGQEVACEVI